MRFFEALWWKRRQNGHSRSSYTTGVNFVSGEPRYSFPSTNTVEIPPCTDPEARPVSRTYPSSVDSNSTGPVGSFSKTYAGQGEIPPRGTAVAAPPPKPITIPKLKATVSADLTPKERLMVHLSGSLVLRGLLRRGFFL